jgi:mannose-6-phosphate isomerase-like protein (cupin superfamily)
MDRQTATEVWTRERCFITELLNSARHPEVSVARTRVEPGVTTELHRLGVAEWYVIEQGTGMMQVGRETPFGVNPGTIVAIPQHRAQRIRNTGDTDLVFLCVCAPRFTVDCYTAVENQEEHNDVWSEPNR